jgi:hypothetical protein
MKWSLRARLFVCTTLIFVVLLTTSCNNYKLYWPLGTWESKNPDITFTVTGGKPDYPGTYFVDGETIEVYAVFYQFSPRIAIGEMRTDPDTGIIDDYDYFCGDFKVKGDKLTLTLLPNWRKMHGIKKIVFTRTEEYAEADD